MRDKDNKYASFRRGEGGGGGVGGGDDETRKVKKIEYKEW